MNWFAEADVTTGLIVVIAASAAFGFAVNHWAAVIIPPVASLTYYLGLWQEIWGNGVGDFWWAFMIIFGTAGSAAAGAGIALRRLATAKAGSRPSEA